MTEQPKKLSRFRRGFVSTFVLDLFATLPLERDPSGSADAFFTALLRRIDAGGHS